MSIIIECRNKTADIKHRAGDWETLLGENITIYPQDQLYVKNSFIDTQLSTNEKVNVENDTILDIQYGYYNILNNTYGLAKWTGGAPTLTYEPITLTARFVIPDPDHDGRIFTATGIAQQNDATSPSKRVVVSVSYNDFDDNPKEETFVIQELTNNFKLTIPALNGVISTTALTFSPDLATLKREFNVNLVLTEQTIAGKTIAVPIVQGTQINIKAGTYDPDDLCDLINEGMTNNTPTLQFPFNGNSILNSTGYLQNVVYGTETQPKQKLLFVPTDGSDNCIEPLVTTNYARPPNNDLFTGASQFELSFNQATKTFEFNFLHTPFYYQTHPAVQILKDNNQADLPVYIIGNQSGIFLQRLSAKDTATNEPNNFWSLLGFDPVQAPDLLPTFTYDEVDDQQTGGGAKILLPRRFFEFGVNTTRGLITTDTAIVKDNPLVPFSDNPINSTATITETSAIKAGISVLDNEDKFGYFIVEIGHKLKNDFYTQENNFRNFQQVVSRYFVQNSYTSGTSDGSLIYTHEGEPTLLQSFRCRILNSDKELANNIGEDNTIHLVLIRAEQPQALPAPPPKQEKEKKDENEK